MQHFFMRQPGTGRASSACVCMAHDNLESPSGERVDLSDAEAIKRWRQIFGVTEEELRTAVGKAGTSPEKVREALRSRA